MVAGAALAAALAGAGPLAAQGILVRGSVRSAEGDSVPHALVRLDPGYSERFSDASGGFLFPGVPAGRYRLSVRQVGFLPFDSLIDVAPGAGRFSVTLRRVALRLREITVRGRSGECVSPGNPLAAPGELAVVFEQLRQNAERSRVLAEQHPFRYFVERRVQVQEIRGTLSVDTLVLNSSARWPYAPGTVVTDDSTTRGGRFVHLPVLADLADSAFHATHCFTLAGMDDVETDSGLVRIDFRVARSVPYPDINGSAWLDPVSYQIRHLRVELTRVARAVAGVRSWSATTSFREIVPNVVVPAGLEAVTTFNSLGSTSSWTGRIEQQRLLRVDFLRTLPPGEPRNGN